MLKEFKIDGYLYVTLNTSKEKINKILDDNLYNYEIAKIEERDYEIAVDFSTIVLSKSKEEAEKQFLNVLFGYDVDNYVIKEL